MTITVGTSEEDAFVALRAFLLSVLNIPAEHIVQGQNNYVPPPHSAGYVVMWPTRRKRLSTNNTEFNPVNNTRIISAPTQITIQMDIHGVNCADNTQIITTLFRDTYGADHFAAQNLGVTPLYIDDGQQMPFQTGEKTFENRWVLYAELQITPKLSTPQEFADIIETTFIEVP